MEKMEEINANTCASKIYAMNTAYVEEKYKYCRLCIPTNYELCPDYKKVSNTSLRYSYLRLYNKLEDLIKE